MARFGVKYTLMGAKVKRGRGMRGEFTYMDRMRWLWQAYGARTLNGSAGMFLSVQNAMTPMSSAHIH